MMCHPYAPIYEETLSWWSTPMEQYTVPVNREPSLFAGTLSVKILWKVFDLLAMNDEGMLYFGQGTDLWSYTP
ncbi:hypothetical protein OB13_19840 [Pontibacter sp. HJ8]